VVPDWIVLVKGGISRATVIASDTAAGFVADTATPAVDPPVGSVMCPEMVAVGICAAAGTADSAKANTHNGRSFRLAGKNVYCASVVTCSRPNACNCIRLVFCARWIHRGESCANRYLVMLRLRHE
jgi:hypothetical protein